MKTTSRTVDHAPRNWLLDPIVALADQVDSSPVTATMLLLALVLPVPANATLLPGSSMAPAASLAITHGQGTVWQGETGAFGPDWDGAGSLAPSETDQYGAWRSGDGAGQGASNLLILVCALAVALLVVLWVKQTDTTV